MKKYIIKILIAVDVIWMVSALIYDYSELIVRPFYLWPIIIICPLYPALLAYIWYKVDAGKKINRYLYALGTIGATYFGISALLFYPLAMAQEGFTWLSVGAIFWVAFYGAQGAYLFWSQKNRLYLAPAVVTITYLIIKLYFDWRYYSFGYLMGTQWHSSTRNLMAGFQLFILFIMIVLIFRRHYSLTK